jgi:putative (di)nucleoside polyphosphate hydrolase
MSKTFFKDYVDPQGFRANVGIILARDSRQLFLGRRPGGKGWQFPQGGVRRGERTDDAMFRELNEEIGLTPEDVELLGSTRGWMRYRLPRQYIRDRVIGQKQRWYLLRLKSDESRLRFDATNAPEFDHWEWVDYWKPVREVVPFKRKVYVRALHELGKLIYPDALPAYPEWWEEVTQASAPPAARSQSRAASGSH